jgi:hypothetical protein
LTSAHLAEQPTLVGDAGRLIKSIPILSFVFDVGLALVFALGGSTWTNAAPIFAVMGATSGYLMNVAWLAKVVASRDEVILTNYFTTKRIARSAIVSIDSHSGIYVDLRNGRSIPATAFDPTLGKRLFFNKRGPRFAADLAAFLGLGQVVPSRRDEPLLPSDVVSTFRWDVLPWAVGGALMVVGIYSIAYFL